MIPRRLNFIYGRFETLYSIFIGGESRKNNRDEIVGVFIRDKQWHTQEFFSGGGVQQIQLRTEDKENEDLGAVAPLVRGSGGSCNFVQEISFHIVKFSKFFVL